MCVCVCVCARVCECMHACTHVCMCKLMSSRLHFRPLDPVSLQIFEECDPFTVFAPLWQAKLQGHVCQ